MADERLPLTPDSSGSWLVPRSVADQRPRRGEESVKQPPIFGSLLCSEASATAKNAGLSPPLLLLWASLFNEVFQEKEMIIKKDFMLGFNLVKVFFYPLNVIYFKMEIGAPEWKFKTFGGFEETKGKRRPLIVWHHSSVKSDGYLIKSKRRRAAVAHCVAVTSGLEVREAVSVPWTSQINLGCENEKNKKIKAAVTSLPLTPRRCPWRRPCSD